MIRKTFITAAFSLALAAGPLHAGGMAEPMMEPEVIEEQASRSGGVLVPLLILALLVAVISNSDGGGSESLAGKVLPAK